MSKFRAILFGFVASLLALPTFAAIPDVISITLTRNPDGTYSPEFRQGNKPPDAPTLTCDDSAAPSLTGLETGTAYAQDVRQYFSGTGAAGATLSVVTVSGDDATSEGWAISSAGAGNNLTHPGTGTGSGSFKVRGTTGGNSVDCSVRAWSYADPPPSDALAPTVPTGCTTTAGSGTVTLTCNPSQDPHDGTNVGSGVDEYDIRVNGSALTTLTSQPRGLSQAYTQYILGSSDGTPSSTQSGADWTLVFGGTGIASTSDNAITRLQPVAGDAHAQATVNAITSASTSGTAGVWARESSAAGSRFVACRWFANSGTPKLRLSVRSTADTAPTNIANLTVGSTPYRTRLERSGDTWTCKYAVDGGSETTAGTTTLALPASVLWGPFCTSSSAGVDATCDLDQVVVNNTASFSYAHTTTTGGSYDVRARDVDNNNSSYSVTVVGTPSGGGDVAGPTNTVAPTGAAASAESIAWNCGTWTDPSGVATYTPSTASTSVGPWNDQSPQATNLYTQTGLSANSTRWLRCKATDSLGNIATDWTNPISVTTPSSGGALDLYDPMNGSYSTSWNSTGAGVGGTTPSTRRSFDTSIKRAGSAASKMIVREDYASHPERTEIRLTGNLATNTDWWMGVSTYVPTWSVDPSTGGSGRWDIGFQCHGTNEGTATNPNCVLDMTTGRYVFSIRASTNNDRPYTNTASFDCGAVVAGVWVDWVLNFRFGSGDGSSGYFKVWKDGVQCVNHTGINWFIGNSQPPYFKMGIYKGWGSDGGTVGPVERVIYHDEFRLGKGSSGVGYGDVVPR